ncbi:9526_t:CDS:1, partial [Scutellospora calospora]
LLEIVEIETDTTDAPTQTELDHFFDGKIQTEHLINDELERYEK